MAFLKNPVILKVFCRKVPKATLKLPLFRIFPPALVSTFGVVLLPPTLHEYYVHTFPRRFLSLASVVANGKHHYRCYSWFCYVLVWRRKEKNDHDDKTYACQKNIVNRNLYFFIFLFFLHFIPERLKVSFALQERNFSLTWFLRMGWFKHDTQAKKLDS